MSRGILLFIISIAFASCKKEYSCESCIKANQPPIAIAGIDKVISLPLDTALLDGSASRDPDGKINTWEWKKVSGPNSYKIEDATKAKTIVKDMIVGVYLFKLTVTDDMGLSSADTIQVSLLNPGQDNKPPIANAGLDQTIVLPNNSVVIDGSQSFDPDNNISSYRWTKLSGPLSYHFGNATAMQTTVSDLIEGDYLFELAVTDSEGLMDKDSVHVILVKESCYESECIGFYICLPQSFFQKVYYRAPTNRTFPGAFGASTANNNKLFFGGGHEEGYIGTTISEVNIFDIGLSSWFLAYLSIARSYLSAGSCGNKVLFAGGNNIYSDYSPPPYGIVLTYYDVVDIYDAGNFSRKSAHLSEARSNMAAVSTTKKIFFIGGKKMNGFSSKMDVYDCDSDSWSVIELPHERADAGAIIARDKIYIAGGKNSTGNIKTVDVYDLTSQSWSSLLMPHEHPVTTMALVQDKILIAGGDGLNNKSVDIYNLQSEKWYSSELSDSRYNIAVASANNKVILLGGNYSCNIDIYDSKTDTWRITHLNDGVNGVSGTSATNLCAFMGFLYQKRDALTNSLIMIDP